LTSPRAALPDRQQGQARQRRHRIAANGAGEGVRHVGSTDCRARHRGRRRSPNRSPALHRRRGLPDDHVGGGICQEAMHREPGRPLGAKRLAPVRNLFRGRKPADLKFKPLPFFQMVRIPRIIEPWCWHGAPPERRRRLAEMPDGSPRGVAANFPLNRRPIKRDEVPIPFPPLARQKMTAAGAAWAVAEPEHENRYAISVRESRSLPYAPLQRSSVLGRERVGYRIVACAYDPTDFGNSGSIKFNAF
jgi:hypothetical protein